MSDNKYTRFYLDTEFNENGTTIKPISIGLCTDAGAEFYEVFQFEEWCCSDWVKENVFPVLGRQKRKPAEGILREFSAFVLHNTVPGTKPQFWAYYAAYDWVLVAQMFGRMIDLPKWMPMYCLDLKQMLLFLGNPEIKKLEDGVHNALEDAKWLRDTFQSLSNVGQKVTLNYDRDHKDLSRFTNPADVEAL